MAMSWKSGFGRIFRFCRPGGRSSSARGDGGPDAAAENCKRA